MVDDARDAQQARTSEPSDHNGAGELSCPSTLMNMDDRRMMKPIAIWEIDSSCHQPACLRALDRREVVDSDAWQHTIRSRCELVRM